MRKISVHATEDCGIIGLVEDDYTVPPRTYEHLCRPLGVGAPGGFAVWFDKSANLTYNMLNRTAGR